MAQTHKRLVGDLGEREAVRYLEDQGFEILQQNYLRKWGEIDIIARKNNILHFVEVKTITSNFYIQGTDWYRAVDNIHKRKLQRLRRAIQTYLLEQNLSIETEWEFSAITIVLKRKTRELYKLEHLENLII